MFSKYLINALLLCTAALVSAGDDCWEVKSVKELQEAIDKQVSKDAPDGFPKGHPVVVSICKGTKVLLQKGDKTIKFPALKLNESFVLKCEEPGTCVMDGGLLQKQERLFVGSGGFSTVSLNAGSLFLEGIVFQNFGVTGGGGVFNFKIDGLASVYIYKCVFFENISKGAAGGAILISGSNYVLFKMEAVHFKGNKCMNGFGGALTTNGQIILDIRKGIFNHNEAEYGGAISAYGTGGFMDWYMDVVDFQQNKALSDGGAIYFGKAAANWMNMMFKGNEAGFIGEAYFQFEDSDLRGHDIDYNKDTHEAWCNPSRSFIVF